MFGASGREQPTEGADGMAANLDTSPGWRTAIGDDVTKPDELELFVAYNTVLDRRFQRTQHTWVDRAADTFRPAP